MSIDTFNLFLGVMSLIALFVFIALYFVKAGYGIFRTASWGVAQLGEHLPCKQGVKSSNLSVSIVDESSQSTKLKKLSKRC